ncbi:MAG: hypothetical protein J6N19_18050 [Clostridium sp.]|nr:hypothetical protein [Clostridium sp.]
MGGRGNSFNSVAESAAYRNALNAAENGIKHDKVETAILLDKDGNTIFTESQGSVDSVYFTPDQFRKMQDGILTHNHPSGSTFSDADIDLLVRSGLKEIRATSANRTYRLVRLKGTFPDRASFQPDFSKAYQANKAVCDAKYQKIESNYNSGAISYNEYADQCSNLNKELNMMNSKWISTNARRYGYRYEMIGRN